MRRSREDINDLIVQYLFEEDYNTCERPDFAHDNDTPMDELIERLDENGWRVQMHRMIDNFIFVTVYPKDREKSKEIIKRGMVVENDDIGYGIALAYLTTLGVLL